MKKTYKIFSMKMLLSIILLILIGVSSSLAKEIGIIGFVVGDAFNQDGKKLNVGDPVYFGDTLVTKNGGKSQILFVDQTLMNLFSIQKLPMVNYFQQ